MHHVAMIKFVIVITGYVSALPDPNLSCGSERLNYNFNVFVVMPFRLLVPGQGFPSVGFDPSSSSERASWPSEQSHHESLMPRAHDDCQAPTVAGLSSQTSTLLFSPLTEDSHAPIEPFGAASQHLYTASQLVPAASQEPDTSSQPMDAASQELPSASVPVGASSKHSDAASQPDTAASQLPNAPIEPLASSHQQSHQPLGATSPLTDSASPNPQADVTVAPAQSSDHRLHAGSRQGVVMLLCILSLMPRSPSFYLRSLLVMFCVKWYQCDQYYVCDDLTQHLRWHLTPHLTWYILCTSMYISVYTIYISSVYVCISVYVIFCCNLSIHVLLCHGLLTEPMALHIDSTPAELTMMPTLSHEKKGNRKGRKYTFLHTWHKQ